MNHIEATIKTQDGQTFTINPTKASKMNYKANASSGDNIVFGYTAAASFDFSLLNVDGQWDSAILKKAEVKAFIKRDTGLDIPLGTFDIEDVTKTDGAISLTSIDRMVIFDQKFLGGTFPMTLGYFVNLLCEQVGIKLAAPVFPNSDYTIKDGEAVKGVSCRNLLSLACELAGSFAIINTKGELELKWFDFLKVKDNFDYSKMSNFAHEETPLTMSGVRMVLGEESILSGTDGYPIELTANNILFNKADKVTVQGALDNLYNSRVKLMTYLPCTLKATNPNPELQVGDVIKVKDHKQKESVALVTTISINGYVGIEATSPGKAKAENSRYTQGVGGGGMGGDPGDKIGFVTGYNTAVYTFTDSAQTVAACALTLDTDTRFDVQIVGTYTFTPTAPAVLNITGDLTGNTTGTLAGTINTTDPTKITGDVTGTTKGALAGTGAVAGTPPLITIEYRVNALTQMTFYQYPHPGKNTFSASFIPTATRPGTASIDLRFTIAGGALTFEKREAIISLLVKNGDVVDTPPWPEINLSQSFSPIVVEDNGSRITIAPLSEKVTTAPQAPAGGTFTQVFTGITILDSEPILIGGLSDTIILDRVIGGEVFKFNTGYAEMYNYSTKYINVSSTDFKEQDSYRFTGIEKPIDTGLLIETTIVTEGFKNVNSVEVGVK